MKRVTIFLLLIFYFSMAQSQNPDSLLKVIQTLQKEKEGLESNLSALTAKNNKLTKDSSALQADKDALTERLRSVDKTLPSSIQPGQLEIHDDKVYAEFFLNTRGTIAVSIFKKANRTPEFTVTSNYEKNPVVQLQPLLPDNDYTIVATVVDYAGKETNVKANSEIFDKLNIHTRKRIDRPNIQLGAVNLLSDQIAIPVTSDNPKILASYTYYKIVKSNGQRNRVLAGSNNMGVLENRFGKIEQVTGVSEIKIPNLTPETEYDIDLTFYNEYGKITPATVNYTTTIKPLELNFVGGLNLNFNVLKTTISWKTTKKPSEAYINFETLDGKTDIQTKAEIKNDSCFVVLDFDSYNKILGMKSKNSLSEMPIINAVVKDEAGSLKKASFRISFTVPSEKEIASASGEGLTPEKKKALKDSAKEVKKFVTGETSSGSKIKWEKIVQVGLPIALSLL